MIRVVNWNVQWATPRSARTPEILRRIDALAPEVVCLTETHDQLPSRDGYSISAQPDYGYGDRGARRKVMLWSKQPWRDVDDLGHKSLTPGRFISGITETSIGEVMVMGICIPWFGSRTEARRGAERRERWQDHQQYLAALTEILAGQAPRPTIVMGDFNQVIGQGARAPVHLRETLKDAFSLGMTIVTADVAFEGRRNIDHIALSRGLACESVEPISNIHNGKKLSDHYGVTTVVSPVLSNGMIRVVSWNINRQLAPWRELVQMDADVALVQEAWLPPEDVSDNVDIGPKESYDSHHWNSDWWKGRGWQALYERWPMVVKLSDRVDVEWFNQISPSWGANGDEIEVSGVGILAAARVTTKDGSVEPFIAVSMYGRWLGPHASTGSSWIYGDASVHRIISDLSTFIGHENPGTHRIVASGDLNIFHGYGDNGDPYWESRYRSVFDRMAAIGLEFIGPQAPNGRQAERRLPGEPPDSRNVVTYSYGSNPAPANNRQLDFAFASRGFHESINVRALNEVDEWGPSDHCRILIEIDG